MMSSALFALLVVIVVVNGKPSCDCDDDHDPWCGEEGTYSNLCELKCAGDEVEGHDTCENIEKCLEGLSDTDDGTEVCAQYGNTFESIKEMECHNLKLVHTGECED